MAGSVRQQSRGPYRQRSLWRLLRVESSSADVLDHAAQGFRLFVEAEASGGLDDTPRVAQQDEHAVPFRLSCFETKRP